MRRMLVGCLLLASSALVFGGEKLPPKNESVTDEHILIQLEKDWNQAITAKDYKLLDRIMGNDWVGIDFQGMAVTKAESIAEIKAGNSSNEFVELGDMQVRVFDNTAVVIGTDTEKSVYHGKDSSGRYAFMDVFVKRDGRWQAVASQSTKLKK